MTHPAGVTLLKGTVCMYVCNVCKYVCTEYVRWVYPLSLLVDGDGERERITHCISPNDVYFFLSLSLYSVLVTVEGEEPGGGVVDVTTATATGDGGEALHGERKAGRVSTVLGMGAGEGEARDCDIFWAARRTFLSWDGLDGMGDCGWLDFDIVCMYVYRKYLLTLLQYCTVCTGCWKGEWGGDRWMDG